MQKPRLAVWKFTSCSGCQLNLLNCEDELAAIADVVKIACFAEVSRAILRGPYDISLVEGSITTPHDAERIHQIRRASKRLISIGACAAAGGIQALRNGKDVDKWVATIYASPQHISTLKKSTPISEHVVVDYELRGCPVDKRQLLNVLSAFLHRGRPNVTPHSVCMECKARGHVCLMVTQGIPCLGPVTHAGCRALCPSFGRGCFGCFGPKEAANTSSLGTQFVKLGMHPQAIALSFRTFNAGAESFRRESERHEQQDH